MIVLDASVLIAYLDRSDTHHDAAEALLVDAVDDDLGADPLTLAEVLVVPARMGRLETAVSALRDLDVASLPFPGNAAVRLAELRASTGLKVPGCCVLLAAEHTGASIASFDAGLAQAAEARGVAVRRR